MIDGIQISHDMCPESGKKVAGKGADTDQTVEKFVMVILIVMVRCVSAVIVYGHLIACDETAAGDDPQPSWDGEEHQEVVLGQAQVISKHI